jgi:hypothetical protein
MHLLHMNSHYRAPERWNMWTAGLIGGAIGIVVMGTLWYMQTKTQTRQQRPKCSAVAYPALFASSPTAVTWER